MSKDFENQFDEFAADHADLFLPAVDAPPGQEHLLEFHDCYHTYLNTFEGRIKRFIEKDEGTSDTVEQFFEECNIALEELDAFHPKRFFIEALLATTEYPIFFTLMIGEARKIKNAREESARGDNESHK